MYASWKLFSYDQKGTIWMVEFLKQRIISEWLDKYRFNDGENSAIFLAWAPGAWKTEFIKSVRTLPEWKDYIVLDTDEYRCLFKGYKWSNASDFQQFASRVMDRMYSFCMKEGLRVIIDGTFAAKSKKIDENIAQCLKRKRLFTIILIYQDPIVSYLYTKIRELEKKRNIPFADFVRKYFESIENVFRIAKEYPVSNVQIVLKKILSSNSEKIYDDIRNRDDFYSMLRSEVDESYMIDRNWSIEYTKEELEEKLWVLDDFIAMLKKDPSLGEEISAKLKPHYDTNE